MVYIKFSVWAGLCVLFLIAELSGQVMNHPLAVPGGNSYITRPDIPDTIRALAIMVQFQPDNDSRTTGNGQFDLSETDLPILNPPPHNAQYFEYHLEFARRYFREVSGNRFHIEYTVWDQIFTLSDWMGAYSPRRDGDFSELGKLFEEAWQLAATEAPAIPFHEYDTFIIFHAGVGRNIDLTSIYGFDPTPLDIPSVYLSPASLRRIFGEEYEGVEVGPQGFRITNSMILPETQSRELELVTGTQLLQLGMNGLVCAMFGSRLGLPDLFNTDTGRSGIGRFGLMDGQAIFSFMGLFPPELSAWEKYFLGWVEPVDVPPGEHIFELPAVALREEGSVLRVPINSREYYLVENRNRNPYGTGQTLTLIQNGEEVHFHVDRDRPGFNAFNISDIHGVVLDVEIYDWSLPGGYIEADDLFYDGGIVIWHIDERIISERIGENRINADVENRGVRVIEADGSQDIGREYPFLHPGQGSEDGTPLDFWFYGNPAPIYQNRFDASTIPPSVSNTGAPSNVAMFDFSERGPRMQLRVRVGSDKVSILSGFPYALEAFTEGTSPVPFYDGILFVDHGRLTVIDTYGNITHGQEATEHLVTSTPAWLDRDGEVLLFTRSGDSGITRWSVRSNSIGHTPFRFVAEETFNLGEAITAGPALFDDGTVIAGTESGHIYAIANSQVKLLASFPNGEPVIDLHVFDQDRWAATSRTHVISSENVKYELPAPIFRSTAYTTDTHRIVACIGDDSIYFVGPFAMSTHGENLALGYTAKGLVSSTPFGVRDEPMNTVGYPIAVDVDRDGVVDVVVPREGKLFAFHTSGAMMDYFPVTLHKGSVLSDLYPVAADFDGSGKVDIAISNARDLMIFYNSGGSQAAGTPIAVGERVVGSPAVINKDSRVGIALITEDNLLYAYQLIGQWNERTVQWGEERYDTQRRNVQRIVHQRVPISDELLPQSRAYNWPNPVYDGRTYIRYYLGETADVTITIYEMNGTKITSFDGPGFGGMENEIEFDTSTLQSGVYLGRVEARTGNNSKVVFIKIAVVR